MQEIVEGYRLSPQQRHLWALLQSDSPLHALCAVLIEGDLKIELLEQALDKLVERHEILRTRFAAVSSIKFPVQIVNDDLRPDFSQFDLSRSSPEEQALYIEAFFETNKRNNTAQNIPAPLTVSLLKLSKDKHVLLISLSALCADSRTIGNILRELTLQYGQAEEVSTPGDEIQYIQVSEWLNEVLEDDAAVEQANQFWSERMGAVEPLALPLEIKSHQVALQETKPISYVIEKELVEKLNRFASNHSTQEQAVLLSAWAILLSRIARRKEFLIERLSDGRKFEQLLNAVGVFARWIPLRFQIEPNNNFSEVINQINASIEEGQDWEEYYFINEKTQSAQGDGAIGFEYDERFAPQSSAGVTFSVRDQSFCNSTFKLKLNCIRQHDSVSIEIHYDSALFDAEYIKKLVEQFIRILESALDRPEAEVESLNLVGEAERRRLLLDFNATTREYDLNKCAHELFEQQAEASPQATAIISDAHTLTFEQLNKRANQLARYLKNYNIGPESLVGICITRSPELIIAVVGVLKAGGAYVPIDPNLPQDRISFMLTDSKVSVLLTDDSVAWNLPPHDAIQIMLDTDWEQIAAETDANLTAEARPDNLAYVIYTSGSTGRPKGTMILHSGLSNYVQWSIGAYNVIDGDGSPVHSPLGFDLTVTSIFPPLLAGKPVTIVSEMDGLEGLSKALRAHQNFSLVKITPAHLEILSRLVPASEAAGRANAFVIGGEALRGEALAFWAAHAPRTRLINEYGPTETVVGCCVYESPSGNPGNKSIPIGRPIANTQIYILDERMAPVPTGMTGEIYIAGAGLARGYLNGQELTAEKFVPNPFSDEPGARLYRTGDLARFLPDENIDFLGRDDQQAKIRGYRIELGEIEQVIAEHESVKETVVLVRETESGDKHLVAYLVPNAKQVYGGDLESAAGADTSQIIESVKGWIEEKLPAYMNPSAYVILDEFPLTANGKIDRDMLPEPEESNASLSEYVPPRTPVEEILVAIWAELLGVERVGISDNFFSLGGHSLLGTQLIAHVRKAFEVEVPLQVLFESPTIAALAESIEQLRGAEQAGQAPPIIPVERIESMPMSFAQQRLWFLDQLEPGTPAYNIPILGVRVQGELKTDALEQALTEIVRRHEVLRTIFPSTDGKPFQLIKPAEPLKLDIEDLSGIPDDEQLLQARKLASEEFHRSFDLAAGPLFRSHLLRLSAQDHIILATVHHIVSDGWSGGVFTHELATLYEAFSAGKPSPLPELPVQYADFAHWQQNWLIGDVLDTQLSYWREKLAGHSPLQLQTDRPRPQVQTFRGDQKPFILSTSTSEQLKALARQEGVTLFMALLAAFDALLLRYTGQEDISIGSFIANRNRAETEGLIGFFVNNLTFRISLSDDPSFRQLLARARNTALEAYAHQDVPFEKLLESLQLERDLSRTPLFQVMLVLQNAPSSGLALPGLTLMHLGTEGTRSNFDLTLWIWESDGKLSGSLEYNTDLFDLTTIERMLDHFELLLNAMLDTPDEAVSSLSLLTDAETRQVLVEWNGRTLAGDGNVSVVDLFEEQVKRTPNATALAYEQKQLSYSELNNQANQLARYLRSNGTGPESIVAISLQRSIEMIVSLLAVLKTGAAYLPLDPAYPSQRIAYILEDTQCAMLLTSRLMSPDVAIADLKRIYVDLDLEKIAGESEENLTRETEPENLAYIIYTSGSTGQPKGVMIEHRSLASYVKAACQQFSLGSKDRVLQFASISFDTAAEEIYPCLASGGTLVLRTDEMLASADAFLKSCSKQKITVLDLPTVYWHHIVAEMQSEELMLPESVRLVILGGEKALPDPLLVWRERVSQEVKLLNTYGPTEGTIVATSCDLSARSDASQSAAPPIGRAVANAFVYILDKNNNLVPPGMPGQLHIGGAGVARGYLRRPDLTAERFIPNPFSDDDGSRLYKTGDMARYLPDGNLEYLGRSDHQVKIRGFRIELGEIEQALVKHPSIRENVVIARETTAGNTQLVAYNVCEQGQQPSINELRAFLKETLPDYAIPAAFVSLEALPLTPAGKVDRRALPAPDTSRQEIDEEFIEPESPIETTLAEIWRELISVEKISIYDNFFTLGGHSLLATQLVSRIQRSFEVDIALRTIFESPILAELAIKIEEAILIQIENIDEDDLPEDGQD